MLPLPATGPQVKQEQQDWRHQRRGQDDHEEGKDQHMPEHLQADTNKELNWLSGPQVHKGLAQTPGLDQKGQ